MCQVVLAIIAELCSVVNDRVLALTFIDKKVGLYIPGAPGMEEQLLNKKIEPR